MRRSHRQAASAEVQLNLAAMLDMAFQLLAFFMLTFRPVPVEREFKLMLKPPQAIRPNSAALPPGQIPDQTLSGLDTLVITLFADGRPGEMNRPLSHIAVGVGQGTIPCGPRPDDLSNCLRKIFAEDSSPEGCPFTQVILQIDSRVRYVDLMTVIGVCRKITIMEDGPQRRRVPLSKLSFVELPTTT